MPWSKNYESVNKFWEYVRNNCEPSKVFKPGTFMTYSYHFKTEGIDNWQQRYKMYDYFPITFIFASHPNGFTGLNIHHIPLKARVEWLYRLKQISTKFNETIPFIDFEEGNSYKLNGLNYPLIINILRKSKVAIRRYKYAGILQPRIVNLAIIDEIAKFISKTYLNASITDINKRYNSYIP